MSLVDYAPSPAISIAANGKRISSATPLIERHCELFGTWPD